MCRGQSVQGLWALEELGLYPEGTGERLGQLCILKPPLRVLAGEWIAEAGAAMRGDVVIQAGGHYY